MPASATQFHSNRPVFALALIITAQFLHQQTVAQTNYRALILENTILPFVIARGISFGQVVGFGSQSQSDTSAFHALLWSGSISNAADLHPTGFLNSMAYGASAGLQVGSGTPIGQQYDHALLWRGNSTTVVDLHPSGFRGSAASDADGDIQVGSGIDPGSGNSHALLWKGTSISVVDLHHTNYIWTSANAVSGSLQVGAGARAGDSIHAIAWRGSSNSLIDLHPPRGPDHRYPFSATEAVAVSCEGVIVGQGVLPCDYEQPCLGPSHALLWKLGSTNFWDLHPQGFYSSSLCGISGDKQIGNAQKTPASNAKPVIWSGTPESIIELEYFLPPEMRFSVAATAIDEFGNIAGAVWSADGSITKSVLWIPGIPPDSAPTLKIVPACVATANGIWLQISGQTAGTYFLEKSSDFKNWEKLSIPPSLEALFYFHDAAAKNEPYAFYRALLEPY